MSLIVYVHSVGEYQDNRRLWNGPRHNIACAADTTNLRVKGPEIRLYDAGSSKIIDAIACLPAVVREEIEVVDIRLLSGRLKAWREGVFQVPAAILDGQLVTDPQDICEIVGNYMGA